MSTISEALRKAQMSREGRSSGDEFPPRGGSSFPGDPQGAPPPRKSSTAPVTVAAILLLGLLVGLILMRAVYRGEVRPSAGTAPVQAVTTQAVVAATPPPAPSRT